MDPIQERKIVNDFLNGNSATWGAIVAQHLGELVEIANRMSWPIPEAEELARYFLNERLTKTATTVLAPVAAGSEDLGLALASHFRAFAELLWDGHALAADILAGNRDDLSLLMDVYGRTISRWLRGKDSRLNDVEAQTIAKDFLTGKVFLKQAAMLPMVAAGTRPLRPRLMHSLGNFLNDVHRGIVRGPKQWPEDSDGTPIDIPDKHARNPGTTSSPAEVWQEIRQGLLERLEAIGKVDWQPMKGEAAHRQALLLSERVFLLQWTRDSNAVACNNDCIPLAERAMPWSEEENVARIGHMTLAIAWTRLAAEAMSRSVRLEAEDFGSAIGVGENTWTQWLSRGRAAVRKNIDDGSLMTNNMFPHWL